MRVVSSSKTGHTERYTYNATSWFHSDRGALAVQLFQQPSMPRCSGKQATEIALMAGDIHSDKAIHRTRRWSANKDLTRRATVQLASIDRTYDRGVAVAISPWVGRLSNVLPDWGFAAKSEKRRVLNWWTGIPAPPTGPPNSGSGGCIRVARKTLNQMRRLSSTLRSHISCRRHFATMHSITQLFPLLMSAFCAYMFLLFV